MTVLAPFDGLVVIKDNQDASGGFGFPGMTLPEYRPGDTVQPGRTVAEIVDLTEMEIKTKIAETDRAALEGAPPPRSDRGDADAADDRRTKGIGGLAQNSSGSRKPPVSSRRRLRSTREPALRPA